MQYPKASLESLLKIVKKNNPATEIQLIEKTFRFAVEKHKGQHYRNRPFISHLLSGAQILAELNLDEETISAGILHNILDDGKTTETELAEKFGNQIAVIVKEYNKIKEIESANIEKISNTELSNVLLATITDIRTLFLRFATRIDSLRNIEEFSKKEQLDLAKTTMEIYAPICHKLGVYGIKWELEDLAFKKLQSEIYYKLKEKVGEKRIEREKTIREAIEGLSEKIEKENIHCNIYGRPKHFYGIYKKMLASKKKFSELSDLLAIRIICNSLKECYEILGIVHSQYDYVPQFFDDYISTPKPNGYKSIHTTIKWKGKLIEVQIRTWEMHCNAEDGLAAHWQYKQYEKNPYFDKELSIAKQLVEWQSSRNDSKNLMKFLRVGFEGKKIFVFTPKKEVIVLPENSTPIDFAFAVHSDVGKRCHKAKVNEKIVPLDCKLQNADAIEILTSKIPQVKQQWLYIVRSEKAKTKIKQFLGIREKFKPEKKEHAEEVKIDEKHARMAKCCNPVSGDETIGYKTTKRKITIHRKNCKNIEGAPKKMLVKISLGEKESYNVKLKVSALDETGLLPKILNKIVENRAAIISTKTGISPNKTLECMFTIKIKNLMQLQQIIKNIETIPTVHEVERA